jgi:hypothetical protein
VVILLKFLFLLFPQGYPGLVVAVEAGYYYVRLPFLFYPHAAVVTLHEQRVAFFADLMFVHGGKGNFCGHGNFSGVCYVAAGKLRVLVVSAFGFLEENLNALPSYLLCGGFHVFFAFCACSIGLQLI